MVFEITLAEILGSGLLTAFMTAVATAIFSRRKTLSDVKSQDVKTMETAVKMLSAQADSYYERNKELSDTNDKLKKTVTEQADELRKHRYAAEINELHAKRSGTKLRMSSNEFNSLTLPEVREAHRDISNG